MPLQAPVVQCLRNFKAASSPNICRTFSTTSSVAASTVAERKRHRDPYAVAQAKARKAANLSRQEVLKKERAAALGDPVRGVTTPFVESFDAPPAPTKDDVASESARVNFLLSQDAVEKSLARSRLMTTPLGLENIREEKDASAIDGSSTNDDPTINSTINTRIQRLNREQDTAEEAIRRITSLSLGNAKDRLLVNKHRCVEAFGRHRTDETLPRQPRSASAELESPTAARAGPDTGSSEVQIAILTAKIRSLADFLETRGKGDKANKRNLRLLVHRRQKLLRYLQRKERGGPRWQNLIETLGLTEGTWKGEITL